MKCFHGAVSAAVCQIWVQAHTIVAIRIRVIRATAVTTIPPASTVVVPIVAKTVIAPGLLFTQSSVATGSLTAARSTLIQFRARSVVHRGVFIVIASVRISTALDTTSLAFGAVTAVLALQLAAQLPEVRPVVARFFEARRRAG